MIKKIDWFISNVFRERFSEAYLNQKVKTCPTPAATWMAGIIYCIFATS